MEPNRSDNRRRRVLYDESVQQPTIVDGQNPAAAKRRRSSNYAAKVIQQLRVSDLVPVRKLTLSLIASASFIAVVSLQFLDSFARQVNSPINAEWFPALSLSATTGIASWLTSIVFLLSGIICGLTYSMRRHRRDDYRGTYRVWGVFAAACFLGSLLSSVPIFQILSAFVIRTVSIPALAPGQWGIAALKLGVVFSLFTRAMIEVRGSRTSLACFAAAAAVFCSIIGLQTQVVRGWVWISDVLWLEPILPLVAALLLLNATLCFARFVWMDASGLIRQRVRRKRKLRKRKTRTRSSKPQSTSEDVKSKQNRVATPATTKTNSDSATRTATPQQSSSILQRPAERTGPLRAKMQQISELNQASSESWNDEDDDEGHEENENPRISKAERRRLRKLQRRQRNAA